MGNNKFVVYVSTSSTSHYVINTFEHFTFSNIEDAKNFARLYIETAEFEKKYSGREMFVSVWDECMFPYRKQGEYGLRVDWTHKMHYGFSTPEDYKKTVVWYNKNMPHSKLETKNEEVGIPV